MRLKRGKYLSEAELTLAQASDQGQGVNDKITGSRCRGVGWGKIAQIMGSV